MYLRITPIPFPRRIKRARLKSGARDIAPRKKKKYDSEGVLEKKATPLRAFSLSPDGGGTAAVVWRKRGRKSMVCARTRTSRGAALYIHICNTVHIGARARLPKNHRARNSKKVHQLCSTIYAVIVVEKRYIYRV